MSCREKRIECYHCIRSIEPDTATDNRDIKSLIHHVSPPITFIRDHPNNNHRNTRPVTSTSRSNTTSRTPHPKLEPLGKRHKRQRLPKETNPHNRSRQRRHPRPPRNNPQLRHRPRPSPRLVPLAEQKQRRHNLPLPDSRSLRRSRQHPGRRRPHRHRPRPPRQPMDHPHHGVPLRSVRVRLRPPHPGPGAGERDQNRPRHRDHPGIGPHPGPGG